MKYLLLLVVICSSFSEITAQTWSSEGSPPSASRYDDIVFTDELNGWCVNSNGQIFNTPDGGESWNLQYTSPSSTYMRAIDFLDDQIGVVGSLDGVQVKTMDGGATWVEFQDDIPGEAPGICGLSHVNQTFYGVGAFFYPAYFIKSTDSGETWEYQDMSAYADGLVACHFLDENIGFIGGVRESDGAMILKTIDGGDTWNEVFTTTGGTEYLWKLFQVDDDVFYAALESFFRPGTDIAKSIDGGDTWEMMNVRPNVNMDIEGIGFIDAMNGWVGPRWDPLYETNDGGETWAESDGPSNINRFFLTEGGTMHASGSQTYTYDNAVGLAESLPYISHPLEINPNPIQSNAVVILEMLASSNVLLGVYSIDGRMLKEVHKGRLEKGPHSMTLDLSDLASGSYLLFMRSNEGFQSIPFNKE